MVEIMQEHANEYMLESNGSDALAEAAPESLIDLTVVDFEFNASDFVGTKNTEAPADGPLIGTLRAIGKAVPELEHLTNYKLRQNHASRVKNFFNQSVTTQAGKMRRRDMVDEVEAAQQIFLQLAEERSPVIQAVMQVEQKFGETLGQDGMERLALDVLKYTHWNQMRAILKQQIEDKR